MKLILKTVIFLIFLAFFYESKAGKDKKPILPQAVDISSPTLYQDQAFDVINYSAEIDLRRAPSTEMNGISKIKIFWRDTPEINMFYFHLRSLIVDSVFYNETKVTAYPVESKASAIYHYNVEPPAGSAQDTAIIRVHYHGNMTAAEGDDFGGVYSQDSILYAIGVGISNNYVSTTQHWLACYDHPSDKATLDFRFITDNGFVVASNGLLKQEKTKIDGKDYDVYHWQSDMQTATNLMTFACGKFSAVNFYGFYYPIVVYCRPADTNAVKFTFKKIPEMVTAYQNRFGKYLFEKVGYVLTPMAGGAMEHQTMISMPEKQIRKSFQIDDSVNVTAAHELSHQWFGNSVTPYDYRDVWYNEGFARFSEALWLEELYGYESYLNGIGNFIKGYINSVIQSEGVFPLYDFTRVNPSSNYPLTIYNKGCAVAAMLRYYLGDDDFYSAMMNFQDYYAFRNCTTDSLKAYIEEFTGQNLGWFFDQWVYKKGFPELDVKILKTKASSFGICKAEIQLNQVQPSEYGFYTNLPVEVTFGLLNGSDTSIVLNMTKMNQSFFIDAIPDFNSITINKGPSVRSLLKLKSLITSVDKAEIDKDNINIYPNPVVNIINLGIKGISDKVDYSIVNIDGKVLLKGVIAADNGEIVSQKFNVEGFSAGNYYIKLESKNYFRILNFIKL